MFTLQELEQALPLNMKGKITPGLVDTLNKCVQTPEFARIVRDNMLGYTKVLTMGKFKIEDYVCATVYVSYKLMNYTDREAYQRTFPDRYNDLIARGTSSKDIAAYVSAYNRGQLVNLIYEQTMIPTWVINQDLHQRALMTLADLMTSAKSEMVREKAAADIIAALKKPEAVAVNLNIGATQNDEMQSMMNQLSDIAKMQQKLIAEGVATKNIAHQKLIEGTAKDVTP